MSLHPRDIPPVPEETRRVAQAAFPRDNIYMRMRDELGTIYDDRLFAPLFSPRGQPAASPWRLALTTVMQFAEGLSDRQAVDAVRSHIDWKYALSLELTDSGFDHSVLSEFRTRLGAGQAERLLLDMLLTRVRERGLLKSRGRQRTDSTHVLAAIRVLNRLERVGETLRHALNSLAVVAPDWLRAQVAPEWFDRYGPRMDTYHLPKTAAARETLAATIGADGRRLLQAVDAASELPWLREVSAVQVLRQVWAEQYTDLPGPLRWRTVQELASSAELIASPYDPEARYCTKRGVTWVGYKVHLTETCDADSPHLITHVMTTPATTPDSVIGPTIQHDLARRDLLPSIHLFDSGYVDAELLVTAQTTHQIEVLGPTTRPSRPRDSGRRRRRSGVNMSPALALKARTPKSSDGVAYGAVATSARPKRMCSTLSPPPPSTWYGWRHGWQARLGLPHASQSLRHSRRKGPEGRPREFATSIKISVAYMAG